MSDSAGATISSISYAPFGTTRTGSVPTDIKFTGQRLDDTGLYYYGARYYDPEIGRFISPDTMVQYASGVNVVSYGLIANLSLFTTVTEGAPSKILPRLALAPPMNPQALNRYSYVLNNPLRYTDPTGNINWTKAIIGAALVAIAVAFVFVLVAVPPAGAGVIGAALAAESGFGVGMTLAHLGLLSLAPMLVGGIGLTMTLDGVSEKTGQLPLSSKPNTGTVPPTGPQDTVQATNSDAQVSGGWKPDFTKANPWEGIPSDYTGYRPPNTSSSAPSDSSYTTPASTSGGQNPAPDYGRFPGWDPFLDPW